MKHFDKQKKFWKPTALFKETISIYDITVCGQQKRKLLTYGLTSITYHKDEIKSTTCKSPVKPPARSMLQIQCRNMMGMSIVSKVKNLQSVAKLQVDILRSHFENFWFNTLNQPLLKYNSYHFKNKKVKKKTNRKWTLRCLILVKMVLFWNNFDVIWFILSDLCIKASLKNLSILFFL